MRSALNDAALFEDHDAVGIADRRQAVSNDKRSTVGHKGIHALLDPTGGFLWGFLLAGLAYWLMEKLGMLPAMICAMLMCYLCGSWWFHLYAVVSLPAAALTCVVPWLIPDTLKLALAYTMAKRIGRTVKI